jgi:PAS domain-containing protein
MREFVFQARAPTAATLSLIILLGWLLHRYVASPLEHVAAANSLRNGRLDVIAGEARRRSRDCPRTSMPWRAMQEAQTKLANSELHFRARQQRAGAGVDVGARRGCEYFNEPWLRFTGRTQEQEQGRWAEGVHPDDRSLHEPRAAFNRREPFSMSRLRHVSGDAAGSWMKSAL